MIRSKPFLFAACLLLTLLALPKTASAALGGDESTVEADRIHMQGALMNTTRLDAYTMYEVRSASGIVVHEYVSSSGTVFGVAWRGPWMPDLQQLLGSYFDGYQQSAKAARLKRKGRGPVTVQTADVIVQIIGHPRAFLGSAYATQWMPQGVRPESIK
jgi:hypothetical protein